MAKNSVGAGRSLLIGLAVAVLAPAILVAGLCGSALAGANDQVKLAIHAKAHPTSCTVNYPNFTHCSQITSTYPGSGDVDILPVFFDLKEYTVTEFGLEWPPAWGSMSWVRCRGTVAVGTVIRSGDGTAIAWSGCQRGWSIVPGYGWLAANTPGVIRPVPNPATDEYGVVDCEPSPGPYQDFPAAEPCGAGIGGAVGDDPCGGGGGNLSTWGEINSMFR
jgi:hypothetical protein